MSSEIDKLKAKIKHLEDDNDDLKEHLHKKKDKYKKHKKELEEDLEKIKKIHESCGKGSDQVKDLQKKLEIYISNEQKWQAQVNELNISIGKFKEIEIERDTLKKNISELNISIEQTKNQKSEFDAHFNSLQINLNKNFEQKEIDFMA